MNRGRKNNGYKSKYKFGSHQEISKSDLKTQKERACSPEHDVRIKDIKASFVQLGLLFL